MSKLVQLKDGTGNVYPITQAEVLYNNATGTNGTVTLSETSANFDYIEVFYRNNDNLYSSLKVYQPNGKKITMRGALTASGTLTYIKEKNCLISGTSITPQDYVEYAIGASGISNYNGSNNLIYITRVIGYR